MQKKINFIIPAVILLLKCSPVFSQSETGIFLSTEISAAHDDNIYRVTDDFSRSDSFILASPNLDIIGSYGKHFFKASYSGEYSKFGKENEADYSDHDLKLRLDLDHSLRFSSQLEVGYQDEHEDPGALNQIQLNLVEYNQFNQKFLLAGVAYGQESSIGRLSFDYRRTDKDYTNNNLDYLDFKSDQITGRFSMRVAPKTLIYIEGLVSEQDYTPAATFELDNTFKRYQAGVRWEFSNKLTGDVNIGYQERNYDQAIVQDITGLAYDGIINWDINTYTSINIAAKRQAVDSSLEEAGGFLRTSYSAGLNHDITELLKMTGAVAYSEDSLVITAGRQDERYAYTLGVEYEVKSFITLVASYAYEERESSDSLANFKANVFTVSAIVDLER